MQIRILKPGMLSTIQDQGRLYHLSQAVPLSGAMDPLSARIANIALGNTETAAILEFTYGAASFMAETDLLIAFAGAGAALKADGICLPMEHPVFVPSGMTLTLSNTTSGLRTYLAVAGGWDVPQVLGSRSTYLPAAFGGYKGRALKKGDLLNNTSEISSATATLLSQLRGDQLSWTNWSIPRTLFLANEPGLIRIVPGHEFAWFDAQSIISLLTDTFYLDLNSNRMGCQLKGPPIKRSVTQELISTAVGPGTIQVSGDGTMILLMADCQTTGGYPRIAQVAAADLPRCAQLRPGDPIRFIEISSSEAEILYLEQEKHLARLSSAVTLKITGKS